MKKNLIILATALITLMLGGAVSCSKEESADARDLLLTVPSDVSAIAVADIRGILEDAGCRIEGSTVKPDKEFSEVLSRAASSGESAAQAVSYLSEGGVDPSVAVIFLQGYNTYLAGFLSNPDKFKAKAEKDFGEKFQTDGNIAFCGNTAVAGNRFWICLSSRNTINADNIKHFSSLGEKQSILSVKEVARFETLSHHIAGWGDIKGCLNSVPQLDFATKATVSMAIETMFADASAFVWHIDFAKGRLNAELSVLNSKGGIAAFLYPAAKINPSSVKELTNGSDALVAAAISPKMIKQLVDETGSKGISMLGILAHSLACVDGTCVYSGDTDKNISGFFTTTGSGTAPLSDLLSQYGLKVTKDGDLLRFASGLPSGPVSPDEAAEILKGSMAGAIVSGRLTRSDDKESPFSHTALLLRPEKGGMEFRMTLAAKDTKRNILLTIMEAQ